MNHVEGFLCPVCKTDLGSLEILQQHFSDEHNNLQSDGQITKHIKGFFGRARQHFKHNLDSFVHEWDTTAKIEQQIEEIAGGSQGLGVTTSHTSFFHKTRDNKIDQLAVETNKIIIRLDKLVSHCPEDPVKRREYEQSVTTWESDSTICRDCGSRFTIARRKHHCRLCGKTMCHSCSQFISFSYANRLTNPAVAAGYETAVGGGGTSSTSQDGAQASSSTSSPAKAKKKAKRLIKGTISVLKGDDLSWNSMFDQEGEAQLRSCTICKELLVRREEQMERRTASPSICQFYDSLTKAVQQAAALFPNYDRMAQSLNQGESTYNLEMAKEVKLKLIQTEQQIDTLSKTILNHGLQAGATVDQRHLLLQRNIRTFATNVLQEMIAAMPNLPTDKEYAQLQADYKNKLKSRIRMERETASNYNSKSMSQQSNLSRSLSYTSTEPDSGWTPDVRQCDTKTKARTTNPFDEEYDEDERKEEEEPLLLQIDMIRGYLKQAVQAGRVDEVEMLEKNLLELEAEYKIKIGNEP